MQAVANNTRWAEHIAKIFQELSLDALYENPRDGGCPSDQVMDADGDGLLSLNDFKASRDGNCGRQNRPAQDNVHMQRSR